MLTLIIINKIHEESCTLQRKVQYEFVEYSDGMSIRDIRSDAQRKLKGICSSRRIHVRSTQSQNTVLPSFSLSPFISSYSPSFSLYQSSEHTKSCFLKKIISRKIITRKNLSHAVQLLNYMYRINVIVVINCHISEIKR